MPGAADELLRLGAPEHRSAAVCSVREREPLVVVATWALCLLPEGLERRLARCGVQRVPLGSLALAVALVPHGAREEVLCTLVAPAVLPQVQGLDLSQGQLGGCGQGRWVEADWAAGPKSQEDRAGSHQLRLEPCTKAMVPRARADSPIRFHFPGSNLLGLKGTMPPPVVVVYAVEQAEVADHPLGSSQLRPQQVGGRQQDSHLVALAGRRAELVQGEAHSF